MATIGSASKYNHFVVAAGIGVTLIIVVVAAALLLPGRTLAQAGGPDQAGAAPARTSPPPPPPALHLNPPTATPEPGAVQAGAGTLAGDNDLEVVRFRPQVRIRLGQSPVSPQGVGKPVPDAKADIERPLAEQHIGSQEGYTSPNYAQALTAQGWNLLFYDGFEGAFPGAWQLYDTSDDDFERLWGDTSYGYQYGYWSAWPAARGLNAVSPAEGYPNNVDSWMVRGPFDLSDMEDVFVGFGLWYYTEPEYDWAYFCVSIEWPNFNCDYWSGYSGGWIDQAYWLTSYAGYREVWFAWYFHSDYSYGGDVGYLGPYVDEVNAWGYDAGTPTPTPTPDPAGELIENGSFETGDLTYWGSSSTPSVLGDEIEHRLTLGPAAGHQPGSGSIEAMESALDITSVGVMSDTDHAIDGHYIAYLWYDGAGTDFLYQTFTVPPGVTDVILDYWFGVTTAETGAGRDFFCASLRPDASSSTIWVDLGCLDSVDTTGYWQEIVYALTSDQVNQIAGQSATLVFEMYNTGNPGTWTTGWVDDVSVYAVGGSAADPLDPNEPNDDPTDATAITCSETITGVIGDALGGYDIDWFELSNVPIGRLDIDINADTKMPRSALDSVVNLYGSAVNWLTWNDDDGASLDSYIVYTNTVNNATFYISVESYSGYGSPDSFYDLTVQCAGTGGGTPTGGNEEPPPDNTWTVMLYLNAEDPLFEDILTQYRTDIEDSIGDKSDFLTVTVLYDGSGANDTARYLVQPNGNYTPGLNQWDMGELNMGDANTLANFVTWAMDQYPAENYYLSIDDHGNGVYGISWDQTSGDDQLRPDEVYTALKAATYNGDPNRRIGILDYEACLMGLAENAYDVREWADYLVFSEQISWGINTYPVYFSDLAATDTPLAVGRRVVDRYHAQAMTAGGRGYPHTISLIDTSKMANVRNTASNLGNALQATATITDVKNARNSSQAFAADDDATNPRRAEYIDLWDLADKASSLASTQAAAVKSAVTAAVIREQHASGRVSIYTWDHSRAHGLSIYYPPSKASSAFGSYVATSPYLYQMSRDGTWDEFLQWAVPGSIRRGMSANRAGIKLAEEGDAYVFKYVYLPAVLRMR